MTNYAPTATTMGAAVGRDLEPNDSNERRFDTTPCPRCSDSKGRKTGPTGKDLHDRVLRQRRCSNGHVYVTVEVALPEEVFFSDVDYRYKQIQRESKARRTGAKSERWYNRVRPMELVLTALFKRDGKSVFTEWDERFHRNRPRSFKV